MIYIIFGASGTGKTTLMNKVNAEFGIKAIHKKGTTRERRTYDDIEIDSFPSGLPEERFGGNNGYIYSQYGHQYGIEKKQLNEAVYENYPHFVICNDLDTIRLIRKDYPDKVRVIYLMFDAPREQILEIQKSRGIKDDEIERRVSKIEYLAQQYIHNSSLFDDVINNRYGVNPETELWRQLRIIMKSYDDFREIPSREVLFDLVDYLSNKIKEVESLQDDLVKNNIIEKDFVFIIMPMSGNTEQDQENIHNVYTTIKTAAQTAGYRAERVDRILGSTSIDDKIYEYIGKAELIIADLSYERPNCYFELGYARALGKDLVIIYREGTKVHFDIDHYDNFSFNSAMSLEKELENRLLKHKRNNFN